MRLGEVFSRRDFKAPRHVSSCCFFSRSLGSPESEDGVVALTCAAHLDAVEATLVQDGCVLGRGSLPALCLHQHVQRETLSHDRSSAVFKQQGLDQKHSTS